MKNELRKKLGIKAEAFVLLCIGSLEKKNNMDELLIAVSWLAPEHSDTVLLIVGEGPQRRELKGWVEFLKIEKQVVFAGAAAQEDVQLYIDIADVFVSASTGEGQKHLCAEAASCGLPLICHRNPCLKDVLHENENGFSYESFDGFEAAYNKCRKNAVSRPSVRAAG